MLNMPIFEVIILKTLLKFWIDLDLVQNHAFYPNFPGACTSTVVFLVIYEEKS